MPDEFGSATENQALKELIVARIRQGGRVPFREFMDMCLYHPHNGYYNSPRWKMGRSGDYLTSPEVSPIFGALIGRQLREMWERMDEPEQFRVVEAGAGNGTLCRDVLRWSRRSAPEFFESLRYTLVESSPSLRDVQLSLLEAESDFTAKVEWEQALPLATKGCIITNELLDAMPVHMVTVKDGRLLEIYVTWDGARFLEETGEPSTPEIDEYFERLRLLPGEGCRAEVNLEARVWMGQAARSLRRGFILTLDYGYEATNLYASWRKSGTLLCFYRHNPNADPYARIGHQDMTSHVDFTTVQRSGEEAGLRTLGVISQSELLANLGVAEALRLGEGNTDMEEYYARRRAGMELLDPGGLGRIQALFQVKDIAEVWLRGLGANQTLSP